MRPGECALDLLEVVACIRVQIESVVLNGADWPTGERIESLDDELNRKYGTNFFKCPRFSCNYFTQGFASKKEREGHVQRHERPFWCTDIHCTGFIGFAKEEQLTRHLKRLIPIPRIRTPSRPMMRLLKARRNTFLRQLLNLKKPHSPLPKSQMQMQMPMQNQNQWQRQTKLPSLHSPPDPRNVQKRRRNSIALIATKRSAKVITGSRT
jgi:hypothetical protein